jgi:subtilisin family serine protease
MRIASAAAALSISASLLLAACGGGGGGTTPDPRPTPTPGPYDCPTSGTVGTGSSARSSGDATDAVKRQLARVPQSEASAVPANTLLAVSYAPSTLSTILPQVAAREAALGASLVHSYDFPHANAALRVVSVPTSSLATAEATLRAQSGVLSVGVTGQRRYPLTTNAYFTNDPYFNGFMQAQNVIAGSGAPSTYEVGPYEESSNVPGQWDMHAIGLEHAFGYVNGGTGVAANANALGSASIKIAIIDTGEDASHPELSSKIAYQKCFITNAAGTSQSTGNFATDELGHGTNVSGLAAADSGNAFGFTGAAGKAIIYAYRVFPTPDDNCTNENTNDGQCSSNTSDIAAAINEAVNNEHVNVISMSLGGGGCNTNGSDEDPTEGAAVAEAIAAHVIVVAAAGNGAPQATGLEAPACDPSVIAVGATGLDDGSATGTTGSYTTTDVSGASSSNPVEYVASYSQYGTPGMAARNPAAWGIVAPGGDPSSSMDPDDLHWVENVWTSTPFDSNFAGGCTDDYPSSSLTAPPVDCRAELAGTSMATPHVAGAAALILAVSGSTYASPAAMRTLLCDTADDIGDSHEGCGRLNVYRAMARALDDNSPPP